MKILVTGAAGFIGSHLVQRLTDSGHEVIGVDNLNDYYDVNLKAWRLTQIASERFTFIKLDLAERAQVEALFTEHQFDTVIHLAAQAGVRYSLENPHIYVSSNVVAFTHLLECCRHHTIGHLIFASSSSVYGGNSQSPFSVEHSTEHPLSLYAATKKANEMMAHSYANLFGVPSTGLRFFTVYGPWGRPDMALFQFTHNIINGLPIDVYNHGKMIRDFTYIDDIVTGIMGAIKQPAQSDSDWLNNGSKPNTSFAPYRLYNLGNHRPTALDYFITCIEEATGKKAIRNHLPIQPGDVEATSANIETARRDLNFEPKMPIEQGIRQFVDWYCSYYHTVSV